MKKELIEKLHPANISMENKAEIENLTIEELSTLADTYRNQIRKNLFEVRDLKSGKTFYAHYGSLIHHKKREGFTFEITEVFPMNSTPGQVATKKVEKVEPSKPLEKVEPNTPLEVTGSLTKTPVGDDGVMDAANPVAESAKEVNVGAVENIKALRAEYKEKFGKAVPVKKVNDIEFIKAKLAE